MEAPNPDRPYDFFGTEVLHTFFVGEPDIRVRDATLEWILALARKPSDVEGTPIPGEVLGDVCANVPETDVWVTWLILEKARRVWLIRLEKPQDLLPPDDESDDSWEDDDEDTD